MATIAGSIVGITNVRRNDTPDGALNVARVAVNFAAYTGSTDDGTIAGVGAAIAACLRNGKTCTMRSAQCVGAGTDGTQAIYTGAMTVSSDALTFNLTAAAVGTEITSSTATTRPVMIDVAFIES